MTLLIILGKKTLVQTNEVVFKLIEILYLGQYILDDNTDG